MRTQTSPSMPKGGTHPGDRAAQVNSHIRVDSDVPAFMPAYDYKRECKYASNDKNTGEIVLGWARGWTRKYLLTYSR